MAQDNGARLLAWLWVLILGLPPASYLTLDTWCSLSEPWFAPVQNGGDDIPCITGCAEDGIRKPDKAARKSHKSQSWSVVGALSWVLSFGKLPALAGLFRGVKPPAFPGVVAMTTR